MGWRSAVVVLGLLLACSGATTPMGSAPVADPPAPSSPPMSAFPDSQLGNHPARVAFPESMWTYEVTWPSGGGPMLIDGHGSWDELRPAIEATDAPFFHQFRDDGITLWVPGGLGESQLRRASPIQLYATNIQSPKGCMLRTVTEGTAEACFGDAPHEADPGGLVLRVRVKEGQLEGEQEFLDAGVWRRGQVSVGPVWGEPSIRLASEWTFRRTGPVDPAVGWTAATVSHFVPVGAGSLEVVGLDADLGTGFAALRFLLTEPGARECSYPGLGSATGATVGLLRIGHSGPRTCTAPDRTADCPPATWPIYGSRSNSEPCTSDAEATTSLAAAKGALSGAGLDPKRGLEIVRPEPGSTPTSTRFRLPSGTLAIEVRPYEVTLTDLTDHPDLFEEYGNSWLDGECTALRAEVTGRSMTAMVLAESYSLGDEGQPVRSVSAGLATLGWLGAFEKDGRAVVIVDQVTSSEDRGAGSTHAIALVGPFPL